MDIQMQVGDRDGGVLFVGTRTANTDETNQRIWEHWVVVGIQGWLESQTHDFHGGRLTQGPILALFARVQFRPGIQRRSRGGGGRSVVVVVTMDRD